MARAGEASKKAQKRIGRYLVTGRIGRGGMGMVYRGYDEALERAVAVKTLTVEGTAESESRKRFEIEAKAAARLQHPNILTVFELGDDRGCPFIAMELLPGADLEALLRAHEPLLLLEKLEICAQVCRGLAYAHERGIVHRDIKPSNIRVLDDGSAKIMDFGIAKLQGTALTQAGMMVGTVHYMSPEQIQGRPLDGRSDVFSLGVILHELLAGQRPFQGETATEILFRIVNDPAPALPELPELATVGPRLPQVLERLLAKDPAQRLTAAEAATAIADVLALLPRSDASLALEGVNSSRRLIKEGRLEEGLTQLRDVVATMPGSLEAVRALRVASRELSLRQKPQEPADDFPELAMTYQAAPTRLSTEPPTLLQPEPPAPTELAPSPPSAPAARLPVAAIVTAGALIVLALGWLLFQGRSPRTPGPAPSAVPPPSAQASVVPSAPTPAPPAPSAPAPHASGGEAPPPEPVVPMGSVSVSSAYPLEVLWKGRSLAKVQDSARVSLPQGRQTLTLVAAPVFLRASVGVDVKEGEARVEAPALGRLNIRANPDNCEVFVDGFSAGYLPILDHPVAAGSHSVAFKWPDGSHDEQSVDVTAGRPAYVMGRKD